MKAWFFVFTSVILGVIGQLLMKKGMTSIGGIQLSNISSIFKAFLNPYVFSGFLSYGISSVIWLAAISKLPLSKAYPMLSLGYILVMFASIFFFHETLSAYKIIGISLIAVGVLFIGQA